MLAVIPSDGSVSGKPEKACRLNRAHQRLIFDLGNDLYRGIITIFVVDGELKSRESWHDGYRHDRNRVISPAMMLTKVLRWITERRMPVHRRGDTHHLHVKLLPVLHGPQTK